MDLEPSIGAITVVAIAAYLVLYAMALRHRRNPKLHGGYMLATPLILFESPAGRATSQFLNWPQFADRTPIQEFGDFIAVLDAFAIALAINSLLCRPEAWCALADRCRFSDRAVAGGLLS